MTPRGRCGRLLELDNKIAPTGYWTPYVATLGRALSGDCGRRRVTDRIIENPIINSPYLPPSRHFEFDKHGMPGHYCYDELREHLRARGKKPSSKTEQLYRGIVDSA